MFIQRLLLVFAFLTSAPAIASPEGIYRACSAAGKVMMDALSNQTNVLIFGGVEAWMNDEFFNLSPTMRQLLMKDIDVFEEDVSRIAANTAARIPLWNRQGLNGVELAKKEIANGFAPVRQLYSVSCVRRILGD